MAVLCSVLAAVLESVADIRARHGTALRAAEWICTLLFTVEYGLRLYSARRPARYALSFFGIVDLVSILPTYLSIMMPGAQGLLVVRALRLLRAFRVLKLAQYRSEEDALMRAIRASAPKIVVFVGTVLAVVVITGTAMHLVEGPENGFDDIPKSMYWAIVTMTTVGYGDIAPRTALGRGIASAIMILGYGIIAVPTGIVSAEVAKHGPSSGHSPRRCGQCDLAGHQPDARHCRGCGAPLAGTP